MIATLAALLLPATSVGGQIAAGADRPAGPPGLVIPLMVAGLLTCPTNGWTTGLALGVGLFIGVGALLTPNTGGHPSSGDTARITSTVTEPVALATLVIAGAAAYPPRKGGRTSWTRA
ncbi:hypothetical protein [Streptomyces canus]|uniref:hypothetical protein n=1 Tax=Streptomyces canus TaxID=58343 RepID=UPI0036ED9D82